MKQRKNSIIAIAAIIFCLSTICFVTEITGSKGTPLDKMDRCEKRYDADGPLVMINVRDGIIGFYNCTTPLKYMECDIRTDVTTDIGEIVLDDKLFFVSAQNYIELPISQDNIGWVYKNIDNWTPAVIYIA